MKRNIATLLTIVMLVASVASAKTAQTKTTAVKIVKIDINTAPEADMVSVGIDRAVAKKIVDGRPWRTKRELLFRLLTTEQYEQVKEQIIAHRAK